ncbi:MAG TPA: Fe-S cluster assembly protein SufD [Rhabdochlamydiaceae bacterium]|nr:Fe-S cluster assembly protein SufD [Rhabdochlamydiaceae bacterium]
MNLLGRHSSKEEFLLQLQMHFQEIMQQAPSLSKPARKKAWDHFLNLGLPHKKQEAFQYFPLLSFYEETFKKPSYASLPENFSAGAQLVFVNGEFSKELSDLRALPKQLVILPLADAYQTYGSFLHGRLEKTLKSETNPFACLNLAFETKGLFVFVPPKVHVETPIHCIHLIATEKKELFSPRVQLFIGQGSHVKWISTTQTLNDSGSFSNSVMDCSLEEGSQLELTNLTTLGNNTWHFDSLRATLKKESHLQAICFNQGGKSLRQDFHIQLQGEYAEAKLKGAALLKEQRQTHTHVYMGHLAPHTHSSQLFKTILDETARSSFEGKIYVCKEAQKTEAYQSNHNLLLGEHAMAYSKPNLEIFADDVKASHGATISKLKEDDLFYLKTRGLSQEMAKKLLISAFSQEIVQGVTFLPIAKEMKAQTEAFLK